MSEPEFTRANKGKFYVAAHLLESEPSVVLAVLEGMVIVRAEMLYHNDKVEYFAFGPMFDELPKGATVPEYRCYLTVDDDGAVIHRRWERIA